MRPLAVETTPYADDRIAYLRPDAAPRLQERLPRADAEPRLPSRLSGVSPEEAAAYADRDSALDQRNDTLWDLVVHLRDYVEQLRAERHILREEAQQLRSALADATEEVRTLRASQAAANSNDFADAPAEPRLADVTRLGIVPKRQV